MSEVSALQVMPSHRDALRTPWIDAARGVAVVLVVLMHYFIFTVSPHLTENSNTKNAWEDTIEVLGAFRLPMLFAVSGMLSAKYIASGPRASWRRARSSYYLYVAWLFAYAAVSLVAPASAPYGQWDLHTLLQNIYDPRTPLWFVFALAVYVTVLPLLRRVPAGVVLGALLVLSICVVFIPGGDGQIFWLRVLQYAFFFGVGVYARPVIIWVVAPKRWWVPTLLALVAGIAAAHKGELATEPLAVSALTTVINVVALLGGLGVIALLCNLPAFRVAASWTGKQTLPIYLLHIPSLWLVSAIPAELFGRGKLTTLMWPVVGTVMVVGLCLAAGWLIRRAGGWFMFAPPVWVNGKQNDKTLPAASQGGLGGKPQTARASLVSSQSARLTRHQLRPVRTGRLPCN